MKSNSKDEKRAHVSYRLFTIRPIFLTSILERLFSILAKHHYRRILVNFLLDNTLLVNSSSSGYSFGKVKIWKKNSAGR